MQEFDIAIRCGWLLTMKEGEEKALKDQLLGIKDKKISFIGPWSEGGENAKKSAKKFIDAGLNIVMPGLINCHTHLPMSLFRGLADDLPFQEWLNSYIFPLESRIVDPEFVRLGTELSALEALLSGTTTVCDMYYFENEIADVIDKSGMRGVLGETIIDFPAPDNKKQDGAEYKILDEMRERYKGHERIKPALAPHAPYTCSDKTLTRVVNYAKKHGTFITIHVSETAKEVEDTLKTYGVTPVERLKKLGFMDVPSLFAHCVHLKEKDFDLFHGGKASVVHNPESNMKLGSGTAPVKELLSRGVNVCLGTDSVASNNDLDLFKEMDTAAKLQKLVNHDNTAMTAATALKMTTLWGARALGIDKVTGSIEVGKHGDCIVVNAQAPRMQPIHNVLSNLVYSATGSEVETVIVHGRVLVENKKALTIDRDELYSRIKDYRSRKQF